MSSSRRLLVLCCAAPLALLGGCNTTSDSAPALGRDFGEATKYNAALQVIDPSPVYPAGAAEAGVRGDTGAAAVQRLRTDKVKIPQPVATGGSGGGSGPQ